MDLSKTLRIGTRGSALALVQAEMTEAALRKAFPDLKFQRIIIKTTGDRRTDVALKDVAASEQLIDKGVFIKELEIALTEKEIDIAVHSLKDVPTVLEDEYDIAAVLERAPTGDVLVTKSLKGIDALPSGAQVATSSVRRKRQLLWMRHDLEVVDIRGNVPTRLEKLADSESLSGTILAEAGLRRLGYDLDQALSLNGATLHFEILDPVKFLPAAGQGAVAFEIRKNDDWVREIVSELNHEKTFAEITAERRFLELLDAGCHTPVGIHTLLENDAMTLHAFVFSEEDENEAPKSATVFGSMKKARELAEQLFSLLK